jgi:transcriptional regulator
MYLPRQFQEQDPERLLAFMRRHSFATLVTVEDGVPFATHLPFLVEPGSARPGGRLLAHMARANPQWRAFSQDRDVLVIFQGPHTYVSPSWYVTEPNVPTWNYAVVHQNRAPEDRRAVMSLLERSEEPEQRAVGALMRERET